MTKLEQRRKLSDDRISDALETLRDSPRGQDVLRAFRSMVIDAGACGLDSIGMNALVVLTDELKDGRREFVNTLPKAKKARVE